MKRPALIVVRCALVAATCGFASLCSATAIPDPVIWYDMESVVNGKVPDKSGNGCDLTIGAGCSLVDTDRMSKGLRFDATTKQSYATFSCPALADRTISLWFKRAENDGTSEWPNGNKNSYPHLLHACSRFRCLYGYDVLTPTIYCGNPEKYATTTMYLDKGSWVHLALTIKVLTGDDAGKVVVAWYKNGSYVSETTVSGIADISAAQTAILGNNAINGERPVNGIVDDLRIYDEALDDGQILYVAANDRPAVPPLIAAWDFNSVSDEANGTHAAPALTEYATSLTMEANVSTTNGVAPGTKSLWFNGTSATLVSGQSRAPFVVLDVTVAGWFRQSVDSNPPVQDGNTFNRVFGLPNGMAMQVNARDSPENSVIYYARGGTPTVSGMRAGWGWSHFAISEQITYDESSGSFKSRPIFYCNGELVATGVLYTVSSLSPIRYGSTYYLGSAGQRNRVLHGALDGFRVYAGILNGDQVRELYRGAAKPDAGEDFSTAVATATLRGKIAASAAESGLLRGYAGTGLWTQISGPTAEIFDPAAEQTDVTLPEVGEYTFRLTVATDMGDTRHDDVTVRRVAATPGKAAPSVSISCATLAAELPAPLKISATASDPDGASIRLVWSLVSGPGAVRFSTPCGSSTEATFSAVGTYVVRCTAENADASAFADVTVTVTDSGVSAPAFLTNGLVRYWSFDKAPTPWVDGVAGTVGSFAPDINSAIMEVGVSGNGVAGVATPGYFNTAGSMRESGTAGAPPSGRWYSVSLWMYHDPDQDVSMLKEVSLVSVNGSLGIRYNCEDGIDGFTLYHQGQYGAASKAYYPRPIVDPKGRWTHVVAVLDRTTAASDNASELWVDGVQLAATGGALGAARVRNDAVHIGGMPVGTAGEVYNGSFTNAEGIVLSRTFPGVIDEVRMYTRRLSAAEVKWLAAHPRVDANEGPVVDGLPRHVCVTKSCEKSIGPARVSWGGNAPSYKWVVLGGSDGIELSDNDSPMCTVTGLKTGVYRLALEVSDGERKVRSEPTTVEVVPLGMAIFFR